MRLEREYTILLIPDEESGGYTVRVPALPGITTEGDTLEEAIAMAREAIELHIEGMLADGEEIPTETQHPQALVVKVAT